MRRALRAFAAPILVLSASAGIANAQVYGLSPNAPIGNTATTRSTITVPAGPAITSLRVVVRMRDSYDSDLDLVLVHGNTYLRLSSANGDSGQDYRTTRFSDSAPRAIYEGDAPFAGTFRPEGGTLVPYGAVAALPANAAANLGAFFNQSPQGDWTLRIDNTVGGNTGVLEYWSLEFNGAVDPAGPALETGAPASGTWTEHADAGELVGTAQACIGNGGLTQIVGSLGLGDTDLYQIQISDPANFSASTIGGAYFDTRLFLFDAAGNGVSFNDDEPGSTSQSILSPALVPGEGTYYVAITGAGRMAVDSSGAPIWLDQPATGERRPDGPGRTHALAGWTGVPRGGLYRIALTGASFARRPGASADFNGDGDVGTDADIMDFFRCLGGDCCPTCGSVDIDGDGDVGTDADIMAFFRAFTSGA
jgi:subtilisin-like proprotein convertase family protein